MIGLHLLDGDGSTRRSSDNEEFWSRSTFGSFRCDGCGVPLSHSAAAAAAWSRGKRRRGRGRPPLVGDALQHGAVLYGASRPDPDRETRGGSWHRSLSLKAHAFHARGPRPARGRGPQSPQDAS